MSHNGAKGRWTGDNVDEDGIVQVQMAAETSDPSLKSFHSEDWYDQEQPISLVKKESVAASLTKVLISGKQQPHRKSSGISLTEQSNFARPDEEMQIEDIIKSKKKQNTQKTNVRATMGFWKLRWHDFKVWYRRWRLKNKETGVFKSEIKYMESNFGSAIGSLFVFIRWVVYLNFFLTILWLGMVVFPVAVHFPYSSLTQQFAFKNIIDGKGILAEMWLFYGSYTDVVKGYHVGLVYLFMLLVTYFGSLFAILGSISQASPAKSRRRDARFKFGMLLWTSWDHSITAHEASINLSKGITSALKDNLYEAKASQDVKQRSGKEKCKVYSLRFLAWFITIILCGGGCVAIVYLVLFMSFEEIVPNSGSGEGSDFLSVYGTTIIFSLINATVPICIQMLPKMEQYASGRDELNVTLTRVFFLRMANLFALITSLYDTVTKSVGGCAGTVLGQEMYKLVIMDTLLHSIIQLCVKFGKYFWTREKSEFNISSAVLVLVYRQALVWVGTLACPVMPLLGLLSSLVFLGVNYVIVSRTCKPPIKRWNQSRNTSFFTVFLLGSLVMLIPPVSIVIGSSDLVNLGYTNIHDQFCGPFGAEKPTRSYTRFRLGQSYWLKATLGYFVSEPVIIPVFLILVAILFHQKRAMSSGKQQELILHAELQQEREENEKLLKKLQSMGVDVDTH